ncbi:MAG TPA: hypothetical protein PKM41_15275 [Deltaproteobacteria bacterium]|nr:hypothetical protein [Deltaproteobacteria bacterium]HOI08475.1 hypothetical protein [Deltaproteobacteria bacterium]
MGLRKRLLAGIVIAALSLAAGVLVYGCSDGGKAAREAVEDVTGKTTVDAGERLKSQIDRLEAQELERVPQDTEGTGEQGGPGQGE